MRKYLIILLFSLPFFTSCILFRIDPDSFFVHWNIHNCTGNSIVIKTYKSQDTVESGQKTTFISWGYTADGYDIKRCEKNQDFSDLYGFWGKFRRDTTKMVVEMRMITDAVDTTLYPQRVWKYNRKDESGKQFFTVTSWIKNKVHDSAGRYRDWSYTFELYPEDFDVVER